MKTKNVGVILAAGRGDRAGFDVPKQFVELAGKPVIEYAINTFEHCILIDEIIVVTSADFIDTVEEIVRRRGFAKVKKVIRGGKERYHSSLAAINAGRPSVGEEVNLIFHDAARPLVTDCNITRVIRALEDYNAVTLVVPATDTVVAVDPSTNTINSAFDRSRLRNVQTPQGFNWATIDAAYNLALKDADFETADDSSVVFKYLPGEKIYVVRGENYNVKLTYKEDLDFIEDLLQRMKPKQTALNDQNK